MKTMTIDTPFPVTEKEIERFVAERGAVWRREGSSCTGLSICGDGTVFLSGRTDVLREIDPEAIAESESVLGKPVLATLVLGLSGDEETERLAAELSNALVQRWGGVVGGEIPFKFRHLVRGA